MDEHTLEMGCTTCGVYYCMATAENAEELALFLSEHVGHEHALLGYVGQKDLIPPWRNPQTASNWLPYSF